MEKLKHIAQEIGAQRTLERLICAENIQDRAHTHIAIMGTTNCGKTTLINGILGQEIRESSMLPDEGKPVRVAFEHMEADTRCDCEMVFHREWGGINALLYEVNSDRNFGTPHGLTADDFDVVFYLMPASRFMTAEDKKALEKLSYLPINIILTKLDEVRDDQRSRIVEYAQMLAQEKTVNLIIADSDDWLQVSRQMRGVLPITIELIEKRKEHTVVIERECRAELVSALDQAIDEQNAIIDSASQEAAANVAKQRLDMATHKKDFATVKLDCTKTENAMNELIRKMLLNTIGFSDEKLHNVKDHNFSKEALAECGQAVEGNILQQIEKIDAQLQKEVRRILHDAVNKHLIDSSTANQLLNDFFEKKFVNSVPIKDYEKYSMTASNSLVKIGLAVGGVSVAAWLLPISTVLSYGIVAAAVAVGGVQFCQRRASEKEALVQTLQNEIQKLVKDIQKVLFDNVETIFAKLRGAINVPSPKGCAEVDTSAQTNRITYLEGLKADITN